MASTASASQSPAVTAKRNAGTEVHGGDDVHRVEKLVADFSVTTNALGPVPAGVRAAKKLFADMSLLSPAQEDGGVTLATCAAVEHYPQRQDPELAALAAQCLRPAEPADGVVARLVFGNGASELIDLLARAGPAGPGYCGNPQARTMYREYSRACRNAGRRAVDTPEEAKMVCVVNPVNPTGDFLERAEMEAWISETVQPGSWVLMDESMLFWAGPDFHQRGVSAEFISEMKEARDISIFLVHSWTKIFACTGMRIGSTLAPTPELAKHVESLQVPWSLNAFAKAYLKAALQDSDYLKTTWEMTPRWRAHIVSSLRRLHPEWKIHGREFTSWVWIDTGDEATAQSVYETALGCGCPIRLAASGYNLPTFIRLAVRRPSDFATLHQALVLRASR